MSEKVKLHDFIELDYTGKLPEGIVFDTTLEAVAKKEHLHQEKTIYQPMVICVGEKQILPGLDDQLVDKEVGKEYLIKLFPEQAFGKRDVKRLRIVPMSTFQEHKLEPQPGLQINVDGEVGTITHISGGRVMVNFNHPLAGKEVIYEITIKRKITEQKEQLQAFLQSTFGLPKEKIEVKMEEEKAEVTLPMEMPAPLTDVLFKKLSELTKLKEITFRKKESEKKSD